MVSYFRIIPVFCLFILVNGAIVDPPATDAKATGSKSHRPTFSTTEHKLENPANGEKQLEVFFPKLSPKGDRKDHAYGTLPADCAEVYRSGNRKSGIYKIQNKNLQGCLDVYCDMDTNGGGWTVFQRRTSSLNTRTKETFFRTWAEYARGFGDLNREFWLGNDNLFALTNSDVMRMRIDLGDYLGERKYQHYDEFRVSSESFGYSLSYFTSSGVAGDSLNYDSKNQKFSTYDRDNDKRNGSCAMDFSAGWWFNNCTKANLNGLYFEYEAVHPQAMTWTNYRGTRSLAFAEMKFRPISFLP